MWLHLYKYTSTGVARNRRERRCMQSCEIRTSSGILYWTSFMFCKINKMTNWWGRCGMQNTKRLKRETYLHRFPEVSVVVLVFKWACSNPHDIKSHPTRPYISHLKQDQIHEDGCFKFREKVKTIGSITCYTIYCQCAWRPGLPSRGGGQREAYLAIIFAASKDLRWDISSGSSFRAWTAWMHHRLQ